MKLFGNLKSVNGELHINNFSLRELKEKYGTPLYIIDENFFRDKCREFTSHFKSNKFNTKVIYASKALLNRYISNIAQDEGLYIDAVSGGEIFTILNSNMPAKNIYFHGNNKLDREIQLAIENNVGTIVIDNFREIKRLEKHLNGKVQRVLLRVNPGIDAHTHEYISTSKNDSKFGMSIFSEETYSAIEYILSKDCFQFAGIHAHIGSQVFSQESFFKEADVMLEYAKTIRDRFNIEISEVNLGGGFGIYYTNDDDPFHTPEFLKNYALHIEDFMEKNDFFVPNISIEPGRSLISNCGHTLYTVGSVKKTYGGKNYVFIDGSTADNIRPALYGAKYEGAVANKFNDEATETYTIAGKCCESGDILIKDIELPEVEEEDLILVSSTGAYNYSMASNYNRVEKPAMIFVSESVNVGVRRQTYEDLIREDLI